MAIDWFTVAAQIVNFLILVWLLKKLLFRPILNAMERREMGISGRLQQAHQQKAEAEALQQQYQQSLQQWQREKDALMAQAREEAENEKTALLQCLSEEIQRKKAEFETEIQQQQQALGGLISRTLAEKTLSLSDKILRQLADQSLEQRIVEHFLGVLAGLPEQECAPLKQALQQGDATLITRFQPNAADKQRLQDWFDAFAPGCRLTFARRDALMCGIALEAGGRSWEWSIERYLSELESDLLKPSFGTGP